MLELVLRKLSLKLSNAFRGRIAGLTGNVRELGLHRVDLYPWSVDQGTVMFMGKNAMYLPMDDVIEAVKSLDEFVAELQLPLLREKQRLEDALSSLGLDSDISAYDGWYEEEEAVIEEEDSAI